MMTCGEEHPRKSDWTKQFITDNKSNLGNALQHSVDCGLYTAAVPILIQAGMPLSVLGDKKAGQEMRRILFSILERKILFQPEE